MAYCGTAPLRVQLFHPPQLILCRRPRFGLELDVQSVIPSPGDRQFQIRNPRLDVPSFTPGALLRCAAALVLDVVQKFEFGPLCADSLSLAPEHHCVLVPVFPGKVDAVRFRCHEAHPLSARESDINRLRIMLACPLVRPETSKPLHLRRITASCFSVAGARPRRLTMSRSQICRLSGNPSCSCLGTLYRAPPASGYAARSIPPAAARPGRGWTGIGDPAGSRRASRPAS